ncbi:Gfo/Idh/MocA family oxidoreductase [Dactylosporangium sp. CA-092794]|uniref:Gfo/Idh/MocA family oxidoreductase n=1 Tax=Dactylosporangium sp. CA-092794 TaxID=3239929 RepID=UPI003D8B79D8
MSRKRLCMVGAGRVGRLHTRNLIERAGRRAEVAAIVDPSLDTAGKLAADYAVGAVYATLEEALAHGPYDGAVITTPTFTHRALAVAALDAGLHVHLEKPMAMNLDECAGITAALRRSDRILQLGFMRRFDRDFIEAAELLRGGTIGAPMIIKSLTHGPGLPPAWANDIRTSNGMLAEVNSHDLDTVNWFAGAEPVDIHVRVANFKGRERGVTTEHFYDTLLATVTFESGAIASIAGVCPADYGYDARVEVTCTGGMIQVGGTGPGGLASIVSGTSRRGEAVFGSWRDRFADAYTREMVEFLAAMDGEPVRVGAAEGTRAVALVLAGTMSMLERRTVALSELRAPGLTLSWQSGAAAA